MSLRLARTNAEAHIAMAMTPCEVCGKLGYTPPHRGDVAGDGDLTSRYAGSCPSCGQAREFVFRVRREVVPPEEGEPTFGDERPSELLDAGQWLWYADRITAGLPADPTGDLTAEQRRKTRVRLLRAAAAVAEALKFVPVGAEEVPREALWSETGQEVYARRPGRFDRRRLEVFRRSCQEAADRFQG